MKWPANADKIIRYADHQQVDWRSVMKIASKLDEGNNRTETFPYVLGFLGF